MPKNDEPSKLSRGDIEVLCLLEALHPHGCSTESLMERLGFAPQLAPVVNDVLETLITRGLLNRQAERLELSTLGLTWREDHLRLPEIVDPSDKFFEPDVRWR